MLIINKDKRSNNKINKLIAKIWFTDIQNRVCTELVDDRKSKTLISTRPLNLSRV